MRRTLTISFLVVFLLMVADCTFGKNFTLVIDAGHGGHDSGAVGAFSKEKDINLATVLAFGRYVEQNCPDVNVVYTRKRDFFVTLHGRAEIANKAKADLFISIHTNSVPGSKTARGLETYTLGMHRASDNLDVAKRENSVILVEKDYQQHYEGFDPNSAESYIIFEFMQDHNMVKSVDMAKLVQSNVCSLASRPNKGVKQAGFLVLRETSMPSCLIELGFISTPAEEQLLNNSTTIDNIARGIYNAFISYKRKYDTSTNVMRPARESMLPAVETKNEVTTEAKSETRTEVKAETRAEVKTETRSEVKKDVVQETPTNRVQKKQPETKATVKEDKTDRPVFKVQVMANDKVLPKGSSMLKGHTDATWYKENGMVKYTIGESTNYNQILKLSKELAADFPGCFIIAFKNNQKMDVNQAIREFKKNR